jgi:bifunctional non-homologous end joining protein LigD
VSVAQFKCKKYTFSVSNVDKTLFLPSLVTKGDLISYYCKIAQFMLPFTKNHPLTMVRYPNGIKKEGFYQKDAPEYFPKWIERIRIPKSEGGKTNYAIANSADTLAYLANQGCITPHLWLSRTDKLDYPDRMIFDLDPGKQPFTVVQETALALKKIFDQLELISFAMTTGSQGIHVYVPLNRRANFDTVRGFAQDVARLLIEQNPKVLTMEVRKNKRRGRLFIDTLRNSFGATAAAPYSVRPKPGAPIATPLSWNEVGSKSLTPQKYTIDTLFDRLKKKGDVWAGYHKSAQSLTKAQKLLDRLKKG